MTIRTLIGFAVLLVLNACSPADGTSSAPAKTSVYDKVIETGSINCGWATYAPYFTRDVNTGAFGGLMHDIMQEIARRLNLKVDYTTEVGWGTVVDDLRNGKIDMACSYFWSNSTRGRYVEFTMPFVFDKQWIYVRADDTRTWASYDDLNKTGLKISSIDGGAENKIMDIIFPKVTRVTLPELAPMADYYEQVASGKADFLISDINSATVYMQSNPGKLKMVPMADPVHVSPGVMLLPPGDFRFKNMIDSAIQEMDMDGSLTAILRKYDMQDKVGRNVYMK